MYVTMNGMVGQKCCERQRGKTKQDVWGSTFVDSPEGQGDDTCMREACEVAQKMLTCEQPGSLIDPTLLSQFLVLKVYRKVFSSRPEAFTRCLNISIGLSIESTLSVGTPGSGLVSLRVDTGTQGL